MVKYTYNKISIGTTFWRRREKKKWNIFESYSYSFNFNFFTTTRNTFNMHFNIKFEFNIRACPRHYSAKYFAVLFENSI